MSDDSVAVDFAAVSNLGGTIDTQVSQIESELDDLKSQINNLQELWQGSAGSGFQQAKNNWMQSSADLNQVLSRIATAVHAAHDAYSQTESKNSAAWG
jgi:WXG100 family type VII secretion target